MKCHCVLPKNADISGNAHTVIPRKTSNMCQRPTLNRDRFAIYKKLFYLITVLVTFNMYSFTSCRHKLSKHYVHLKEGR